MPFLRLDLRAGEGADADMVEKMERHLVDSQRKLIVFLRLLLESLPNEGEHRIIIQGPNQFVVDGQPRAFDGAALRALLALVLLREKREFKVQEFATLYHGGNADIARTDFDNGFKALKKDLPHISRTASESIRSVSGVKFHVNASDAAIKERLKSLYKK